MIFNNPATLEGMVNYTVATLRSEATLVGENYKYSSNVESIINRVLSVSIAMPAVYEGAMKIIVDFYSELEEGVDEYSASLCVCELFDNLADLMVLGK